ncbi:hypothetical protein DES53_1242 [Roseimicrobium gellanilyticum]|uniref:Lipoprotein SmpA/OmlA domain-containing protein n=1 Tax=Roseimicrobium gellanilyticum TaxID=748857 RepID=A0A366H048_9BACT|nr:hypothetical protein [Roseimicrobium gellanilyticum]RBP35202.1 hypothetical protein DES53_1242 [Roseimicrobium gellanilyticum]
MKLKGVVLGIFLLLSISACNPAAKGSSIRLTAEELYALMNEGKSNVGAGLSPDKVVELIGEPYNDRTEVVWMWSFDKPRPSDSRSWRAFLDDEALFIMFVNGETISEPRSTASVYPWEFYAARMKIAEVAVPEAYQRGK